MKQIIYILILIFFQLSTLSASWEKVTNMPANYLNSYWLDVYFLESNPMYGWACGYGGKVIRTTNGGDSWLGVIIPTTDQLESIHFASERIGYTSGQGSIYRSTDGGNSWSDVTPFDPEIMLWGNYFLTEDIGYVIGGNCVGTQRFYRTTDGGSSWTATTQFSPGTKLSDLIVDATTGIGYASSSGLIWKTTDMGVTWRVHSQTGPLDWQEEITNFGQSFLVPFSEGCDGTTTGRGGIRFSTNDGRTWRNYATRAPMYGTFLIDSLRGWACGLNEEVYYTSDGGATWELINCGLDAGAGLDDIWFINDTTGWLAGQGLYRYKRSSIPQPEIFASGNLEICKGDSVTINLIGNYGKVRWSTGDTTRSITVGESGKYSVYVQNSICEYAYSSEIEVFVRPSPEIVIQKSIDKPLCEGDTLNLSVVSPYSSLRWASGDISPTIEITETGQYTVIITDDFGCVDSLSVDILFNNLPDPKIVALTRTNVCVGDSVLLQVVPDYPNVVWHSTTKSTLASGNYFLTGEEGSYYAEVRDANGCFGVTEIINITVRNETNRLVFYLDTNRKEYFIDSTRYPDLACRYLYIKNITNLETAIRNPRLYYNLSFSMPQSQFPIIFDAFEEKRLLICYSPRSLNFERDTLIVEDVCNDHHLPLVAYGEGNRYIGNTVCDAELMMETLKINSGTNFVISSPYPNPAFKKSSISYVLFQANGEETGITAVLFNALGNEVANGNIAVYSQEQIQEGDIKTGEIEFTLTGLQSGIYFALIKAGNFTKLEKIIIE